MSLGQEQHTHTGLYHSTLCITTNTIPDTVSCWPDWTSSSLLPLVPKSTHLGSSKILLIILHWPRDFYHTIIIT